jgi:hypothetical protein
MVGEIISEWWATSNRNGGRDHSGMVGDIERNQQLAHRLARFTDSRVLNNLTIQSVLLNGQSPPCGFQALVSDM